MNEDEQNNRRRESGIPINFGMSFEDFVLSIPSNLRKPILFNFPTAYKYVGLNGETNVITPEVVITPMNNGPKLTYLEYMLNKKLKESLKGRDTAGKIGTIAMTAGVTPVMLGTTSYVLPQLVRGLTTFGRFMTPSSHLAIFGTGPYNTALGGTNASTAGAIADNALFSLGATSALKTFLDDPSLGTGIDLGLAMTPFVGIKKANQLVKETKGVKNIIKGFENLNIPEGYTPIRVTTLKTRNGDRTVHLIQENSTGKTKILEDLLFKSELDWSPKSWYEKAGGRKYKDNSSTQYTDLDIKDLESHIPEYIEIEKRSKINGTWLRMPDGSMWEGDPRSWVQYMSRAAQEAANGQSKEVFWTGIHKTVDSNYNGRLWGLPVQNQNKLAPAKAATYTGDDAKVMPMFTIKYEDPEVISTVNAKGYDWHAIPYNGKFVKTDYAVDDIFSKRGKKVVKINNVRDTGTERVVPSDSKYYYEGIGNDVRVPQNNVILNDGTFRKALVGGNGNFKHPTHIYRSLIPLSLVELLMKSSGDQSEYISTTPLL